MDRAQLEAQLATWEDLLEQVDVEQHNYVISAEPMNIEEWEERYCVPLEHQRN